MSVLPLQFELPPDIPINQFISDLKQTEHVQVLPPQTCKRTFYDSFDWRLHANNMTCEIDRADDCVNLSLSNMKTSLKFADTKLDQIPTFVWEIDNSPIRDKLLPILEMRALLPVITLESQNHPLNIVNNDEKTILRLVIEEYTHLQNRIILIPLKGYHKALAKMVHILENNFRLQPVSPNIFTLALQNQSIAPDEYSSKLDIALTTDMQADLAVQTIYQQLLGTMRLNEPGIIDNIDTEFLHDFRVAVRRTRTGLSQLKNILPDDTAAKYRAFFAWLGQITGPSRDLDVYVLNFETYKNSLPLNIREDLNPLREFLIAKQQSAHRSLVKALKSAKYKAGIAEWEQDLNTFINRPVKPPNINIPVKQLADQRIRHIYKRIIKEGDAIDENAPATALHDLRKNCKKLRYLIEFFRSLYPKKQIKSQIKALKRLQEVLGDFQDYEVQVKALKNFGDEMLSNDIPVKTYLAMGVLIQNLEKRRIDARNTFAERYSDFKKTDNQRVVKDLFSN